MLLRRKESLSRGSLDSPVDQPRRVRPVGADLLTTVSAAYLALPVLIFAIGWLRPACAIAVAALVLGALVEPLLYGAPPESPSDGPARRGQGWLLALALAVGTTWTVLSGIGGFGFQTGDFLKHDAVLWELIARPWPVVLPASEMGGASHVTLTYSVGWYLPAAVAGKLAGWAAAQSALVCWTILGVTLGLLWFSRISRPAPAWVLVLFPFFGGLDLVGSLIVEGRLPLQGSLGEWWAGLWQYSGNATLLSWSPQHALPAWIGIGLVTKWASEKNAQEQGCLLPVALACLWSPFAAAGLAPFALLALVRHARGWRHHIVSALASFAVLSVVGAYFLSRPATPEGGWMWDYAPAGTLVPRLLLFLTLEVGVFVVLALPVVSSLPEVQRALFWMACSILALLPLYRLGHFNDLAMRASAPALTVVWAAVARSLHALSSAHRFRRAFLLGGAVALGSVVGVLVLWRSVSAGEWRLSRAPSHMFNYQTEPPQVQQNYFGSTRSFFFEGLARSEVPTHHQALPPLP
jgi:hypothetical protein